jgi:signal peptidase I
MLTFYVLGKYRRVLRQQYKLYRRKEKTLGDDGRARLQALLNTLQTAIHERDVKTSKATALLLEDLSRTFMPKSAYDQIRDFCVALGFALMIAIAIRQMLLEHYFIPSGSMRPTFKESDCLLVSKTDFGINTLTRTSHLFFDPSLVQRGSIVIFTGMNMDISDVDTKYFYIIPGKKQYIKRLIGKPGDTVYFYGGEIYGVDADGRDLRELRDPSWFKAVEHVPFIRFDSKTQTSHSPTQGIFSPAVFMQMNMPVGKLTAHSFGTVSGEMLLPVKNYYDLWGFKNFAMARLLTPQEVQILHPSQTVDEAKLYLELTHHPSLQNARVGRDEYGRVRPLLSTSVSLLPVKSREIEEIMRHMNTCRFTVKDGVAARAGSSFHSLSSLPRFPAVANGTYEILDGKGYRVLWGGITVQLPETHPLLSKDPKNVHLLYNVGIEMETHFLPSLKSGHLTPSRFAYFRDGALYLLGAPIFKKGDASLSSLEKTLPGQLPFVDAGPPLIGNQLDADFIRKFGIRVPEKMYLVMGDNHAMSADSRHFGFVPEDNLRGGASFLLWPPGPRWGFLPQPSNLFAIPTLLLWTLFILICATSAVYLRRKYKKPLNFQ